MNQILQSVGRDIQGRGIYRGFVAISSLRRLRLSEYRQFRLRSSQAQPDYRPFVFGEPGRTANQRAYASGRRDSQKFPGCGEHCGKATENHWRQIDPIAVLIHEALLGAVIKSSRSRMQSEVGIRIGTGEVIRKIGCSTIRSRRTFKMVWVRLATRSEPSFLFATR